MDRRKQIIVLSVFAAIAFGFLLTQMVRQNRAVATAVPPQRTSGMVSE